MRAKLYLSDRIRRFGTTSFVLLIVVLLSGCSEAAMEAARDYTLKKHVRFCEEMAQADPERKLSWDIYVDNCMQNLKGHTDFTMKEWRAKQKALAAAEENKS